ncbi:hypothetical protein FLA105534_01739 [Flavobacterium bizetiae]|uniref:Lipoprotein n=1 Tax=Flavobacterium bizetiae TaxID=2704140 RepID=A0A6J4GH62_9FLAO|nr:hypothetical protein [Flavobacterium bizetiae]CAA9197610.1 hypothetical protein FLA105534_01739 [Flavobacterium bizetiae]CAD5341407.1 hypothetical protein FLA105535_01381 [Flavobacterium bizetiae]CAD5347689.1 hypothetical protein FLA105534_01646 [Flavobacterium bizetiae]
MRILLVIVVLVLMGCSSPGKKYDFTFFKWSIHECYYLKLNSSDTLYYIDVYGFKKETSFVILNKEEKERINNVLDTITFPKEQVFDSSVDDGVTNAFIIKIDNQSRKLKIHGYNGPKRFWFFGKLLEQIKNSYEFTKTNKKVDLNEIDKMVLMPVPPNFKVNIN